MKPVNSKAYIVKDEDKDPIKLKSFLENHSEIRFISLVAVDYGNNHTDEKISIKSVLDDLDHFLTFGVQTDGSSNHLPEIATINNAKVDLLPDKDGIWLIEYNYNHILPDGNPCATLKIPAFIKHGDLLVCSRSILKKSVELFKSTLCATIQKYPHLLDDLSVRENASGIKPEDIEEIIITVATELEFWVKSPETKTETEKLTTSEHLKEQYWKRTIGPVRDALEHSLLVMEDYEMNPEMGHKEVGGVTSQLIGTNTYSHVMEQLEVDWKYDRAMRAIDKEFYIKDMIKDTFEAHGLRVTFLAKPIDSVAGSGEHHHIGIAAKLKDHTVVNLFHPQKQEQHFMTRIGYGFLMGILRGYKLISPFVSFTTDSLNRLKPGFEAPVCTVASLGQSPDTPSRNRTVLIALIKELENKMATRFELRSPNPDSNSYLLVAACLIFGMDAIHKVAESGQSLEEIEKGFSKGYGEEHFYLEKDRVYRSEENIYLMKEEERNKLFGFPPATVYENLLAFDQNDGLKQILKTGDIFSDKILKSFRTYMLEKWSIELTDRIIPHNYATINRLTRLDYNHLNQLDHDNWTQIIRLKKNLMKDDVGVKSIFSSIREAIANKEYENASDLQKKMETKMNQLINSYAAYKKNLFI